MAEQVHTTPGKVREVVFVDGNDGWGELWTEGPDDETLIRVAHDKTISPRAFEAFLVAYEYSVTVGYYVHHKIKVVYPDILQKHKELQSVEFLIRYLHFPLLMLAQHAIESASQPSSDAVMDMRRLYVKVARDVLERRRARFPAKFQAYVEFYGDL